MTERIDLAAVMERLAGAEDILLLCHKNPDGDTLGSAGALYWALTALGKRAAIFCSDPVTERYDYMAAGPVRRQLGTKVCGGHRCGGSQRLARGRAVPQARRPVHRPPPQQLGVRPTRPCWSPEAAATAEIIYLLICRMEVEFTPVMADCLYTGRVHRHGLFQVCQHHPRTHHIAAELMERGAHLYT